MTKSSSISIAIGALMLVCLDACSSRDALRAGRDGGVGGLTAGEADVGGAGSGGMVGTGGTASGTGVWGTSLGAGGSNRTTGSGGATGDGGRGSGGAFALGGALGGSAATGGHAATGGGVGTGGATVVDAPGGPDGGPVRMDASVGSGGAAGIATGVDGGAGAGGEAGTCTGCLSLEQCHAGGLCVAKLVPVPAGFSIDATEVTRAQYAAWLATSPSTTVQTGLCAWNTSYTPDAACMATASVCQGAGCSQHPQPCVDMCDAVAYCAGVGKRLCGAIGSGSVSAESYVNKIDASQSQWHNACSSNGANQGPAGGGFTSSKCNDDMANINTTVPVGSMTSCQSAVAGYGGIFDLIGNLWEWEDNCMASAGPTDVCAPRGVSFRMGAAAPVCDYSSYQNRNQPDPETGFRCCVP
jgi:formylglycine-generating enzyme